MKSAIEATGAQHSWNVAFLKQKSACQREVTSKKQYGNNSGGITSASLI
jgi:hypothetical protein